MCSSRADDAMGSRLDAGLQEYSRVFWVASIDLSAEDVCQEM